MEKNHLREKLEKNKSTDLSCHECGIISINTSVFLNCKA